MALAEMPVYKRQQFLLAFIQSVGSCSATDLQKLIFLYLKDKLLDYYCFIPYRYGSYSYQLAEDIDILESRGYITTEPISSRCSADAPLPIVDTNAIDSLRGRQLKRKVYVMYPYYAINSVIANGILTSEEALNVQYQKKALHKDEPMLFTIGYEGKSVEYFVNLLIQNDIRVLCDVRSNSRSRKLGFSRDKLKHIVEGVGIEYAPIPELGIISEQRRDLHAVSDYNRLFADYCETLPNKECYLDSIRELIKKARRVALMCFESDPEYCHRHIIRDYLIQNDGCRCEEL